MMVKVDRQIYDDVCISKAIYSLSDLYTFSRTLSDGIEFIDVTSKSGDAVNESIVFDALNDFKLRGLINEETKNIRTILYAKAFGELDNE